MPESNLSTWPHVDCPNTLSQEGFVPPEVFQNQPKSAPSTEGLTAELIDNCVEKCSQLFDFLPFIHKGALQNGLISFKWRKGWPHPARTVPLARELAYLPEVADAIILLIVALAFVCTPTEESKAFFCTPTQKFDVYCTWNYYAYALNIAQNLPDGSLSKIKLLVLASIYVAQMAIPENCRASSSAASKSALILAQYDLELETGRIL